MGRWAPILLVLPMLAACTTPIETESAIFYVSAKSEIEGLNQSVMSKDPDNVAELEVQIPVDGSLRGELSLVFCNALNPETTMALLGKPEPATVPGGPTRYAVTCVK